VVLRKGGPQRAPELIDRIPKPSVAACPHARASRGGDGLGGNGVGGLPQTGVLGGDLRHRVL
jgi:hypothetical protein